MERAEGRERATHKSAVEAGDDRNARVLEVESLESDAHAISSGLHEGAVEGRAVGEGVSDLSKGALGPDSRDGKVGGPRSDTLLPELFTGPHDTLPASSEHDLSGRVEAGDLDSSLTAVLLRSTLANLLDELSDLLVRMTGVDDEGRHLTTLGSGSVGRRGEVDRGEGEGVGSEETVQALLEAKRSAESQTLAA